jgi:hypothetical protein
MARHSDKKPKAGKIADALTVKSDLKWKDFKYGYEVPKSVLKKQFDHLYDSKAHDSFFKFRGYWYHLSDFMLTEKDEELLRAGWQGYHSDTYFSGVLIKLSSDGESYIIGTYYCS